MNFDIPTPMKAEHDEFHAAFGRSTRAGGRTGEAAKAVAKVLHEHFIKEDEYALPPLSLLVPLSEGVQFASMLAAHAQMEEQVTYPTALLIGQYVKSKVAQGAR
ncbi:MAG: hypothetical protein IT509_12305 [Rhodocyclaceae bacterium]|nr:hypothetical protein [Rhodocyclaceae bacterium]